MNKQIAWKALNAYVDGELSPADAAGVAKAVAEDTALARQVAYLTSLKARVSELQPCHTPTIDLSDPGRHYGQSALVASVALFTLLGVLLSGLVFMGGRTLPAGQIAYAEAAHGEWRISSTKASQPDQSEVLKASLEALKLDVQIPDLTKVRLTYDGIRKVTMGADDGLHIGYRGPHGCMVSVIVFDNPKDLTEDIGVFKRSDRTVYGWRTRSTGVYLLADRMDPNRLLEITRVVHRLMKTQSLLDGQSIIALDRAKAAGQPCTV